jgi:hypothetical protein
MALPAVILVFLLLGVVASLTVAALALAHLIGTWAVFFFYVVPALFLVAWTAHEFAPRHARRATTRVRRRWRTSRFGPSPTSPPAAVPPRRREPPDEELLGSTLRPWMILMGGVLRVWRTRTTRWIVNIVFGLAAAAIAVLVIDRFGSGGWPLSSASVALTAASVAFFLASFAFKSLGWQRLFRREERPRSLALAAATGTASVAGLVLPGRFDDAIRVAVVRRTPGRCPAVGTLVLSLFLLGLIDAGALTPLAATAAAISPVSVGVRVAMAVVAGAGVGAVVVLAALGRVSRHERLGRHRLMHWLGRHAPASGRDAGVAWMFVITSWAARAAGIFVLLEAEGFGLSFGLALSYLAAGAASSALPVGPAAAATQAGVGATVLAAAGISTRDAIAFAVAAQALTALAGAFIAAFAASLLALRRLNGRSAATSR